MICLAFLCSLAVVWGSEGQLPPPGEHPDSDHPKCFKFPVCKEYSEECTFPMKEATHIEYYNQTLQQFGMARFLPLGTVILLDSRNTILFNFHMSISKGLNPAMRIFVKGCDQIAIWRHFFDPNAQYVSPKLSIEEGRVSFGENGQEFGKLTGSCAKYIARMAILGSRPKRLRHKLLCLQVPWEDTEGKFIDGDLAWLTPEEEGTEISGGGGFPFPGEDGSASSEGGGGGFPFPDEDGTEIGGGGFHEGHGHGHGHGGGGGIISESESEYEYDIDDGHHVVVSEEEIVINEQVVGDLVVDEFGHLIHDEEPTTGSSGGTFHGGDAFTGNLEDFAYLWESHT